MPSVILLPALLIAAAHAPPAKPVRLGLCAPCHGESGIARSKGIPNLAGQDRDYLIAALRQYRDGERSAAAMRAVAGPLSDADIAALAEWFASESRGAAP